MKTLFSLILSSMLFTTVSMQAIQWSTDYNEILRVSAQTSKPVIIFFTGTGWCSWCTKLEREVLDTPEFSQQIDGKFLFLKADFPQYSPSAMAASPYKPLLDRYHVDGFPTLVVVDSNGNQLFRMGYEAGGAQKYVQKLLQNWRASQR